MIPTTDFSIRSLLGGFDKNFTYVVTCSRTGAQLIVDAAIKFNRISPLIHNQPWTMLITHTHSDHVAYLDQIVEAYPKMIVLGHPETKKYLEKNGIKIDSPQTSSETISLFICK